MKANCDYFILLKIGNTNCENQAKFDAAKPNVFAKIGTFVQDLFASFLRVKEPQVQQCRDRQGNTWWQAFDPNTRESASFASEAEMRAWIEQRYYR